MKTTRLSLALVAALAVALPLVTASPALANFYGEARCTSPLSGTQGAKATLWVRDGRVVDAASQGHINATLWVGTSTASNSWVEVGFAQGSWYGEATSANYHNNFRYYWADDRPNNDYYEHPLDGLGVPVIASQNEMKIVEVGGGSWDVYINGSRVGTSTNNSTGIDYFSCGLENTNHGNSMGDATHLVKFYGLSYKNSAGTWTSAWPSSSTIWSGSAACMHAQWVTKYKQFSAYHTAH